MSRERIVYLARHGETDWNRQYRWQGHTDTALNDAGRAQAAALAERLRALDVARVHASDLARARETAEIVAAALGLPGPVTDARLRERSFGLFEGLTREECEQCHPEHWRRYQQNPAHLPPGSEAAEAVTRRMLEAVYELSAEPAGDGATLVVGHGSAIRALVSAVSGSPIAPIGNGALIRVRVRLDDALELAARFADPAML